MRKNWITPGGEQHLHITNSPSSLPFAPRFKTIRSRSRVAQACFFCAVWIAKKPLCHILGSPKVHLCHQQSNHSGGAPISPIWIFTNLGPIPSKAKYGPIPSIAVAPCCKNTLSTSVSKICVQVNHLYNRRHGSYVKYGNYRCVILEISTWVPQTRHHDLVVILLGLEPQAECPPLPTYSLGCSPLPGCNRHLPHFYSLIHFGRIIFKLKPNFAYHIIINNPQKLKGLPLAV